MIADGCIPLCAAESTSLKVFNQLKNSMVLFLFVQPFIRDEASASILPVGTFKTWAAAPLALWTKLPAICLNSRYLVTSVETRMFVSSPLAMSSFGTRSMFQSFGLPYFFQGSDPGVKLLYLRKSFDQVSHRAAPRDGDLQFRG